jgi:hypothetical protein
VDSIDFDGRATPEPERSIATGPALPTVMVVGSAQALAACGGGSDGGGATGGAPPPPGPPPVIPLSDIQASRFLGQATMGATRGTINALVARGIAN